MAIVNFEIEDGPILAVLKEARGFDAHALNPGGVIGVQTTVEEHVIHVTLNFQLTEEEFNKAVWQGEPPTVPFVAY